MSTITVEAVQAGEKGRERYRSDKRVKKYLLAKRPPSGNDRIISYRTEACVGHWHATKDGADQDVLDFIRAEYYWAVEELLKFMPEVLVSLRYPVPFERLQRDLFDTPPAATQER